jgi:hypothetical protein
MKARWAFAPPLFRRKIPRARQISRFSRRGFGVIFYNSIFAALAVCAVFFVPFQKSPKKSQKHLKINICRHYGKKKLFCQGVFAKNCKIFLNFLRSVAKIALNRFKIASKCPKHRLNFAKLTQINF